jgi:hypothetical protein
VLRTGLICLVWKWCELLFIAFILFLEITNNVPNCSFEGVFLLLTWLTILCVVLLFEWRCGVRIIFRDSCYVSCLCIVNTCDLVTRSGVLTGTLFSRIRRRWSDITACAYGIDNLVKREWNRILRNIEGFSLFHTNNPDVLSNSVLFLFLNILFVLFTWNYFGSDCDCDRWEFDPRSCGVSDCDDRRSKILEYWHKVARSPRTF